MAREAEVAEPKTKAAGRAQPWTEADLAGATGIEPDSPATPAATTATSHSASAALGRMDRRRSRAFATIPLG